MKKENKEKKMKIEKEIVSIKKRLKDPTVVIGIIIIIALLFYFILFAVRSAQGNPLNIDKQPYLHMRIAENLNSTGFTTYDDMVIGGRNVYVTPYHIVLAGALRMGVPLMPLILPVVFSMISLIFLFLLLRKNMELKKLTLVFILIITSPPFMYLSLVSTPQSLAIMLTLIGIFLFLQKKWIFTFISVILFAIAGLFSAFNIVLIIVLVGLYSAILSKKWKPLLLVILVLGALYAFAAIPFYPIYEFTSKNLIKESISDLGGDRGLSVFFIIFAIIGFFSSWKQKKIYYSVYLISLFMILMFLFTGKDMLMYVLFPLAILAMEGVIRLTEVIWKIEIIKDLTYIMIICGIIFSALSYSIRIVDMPPTSETIKSLEWLKNNSLEEKTVLSHYSSGYWIETVAERRVFLDSYFSSIPEFEQKYIDVYELFNEVDLEKAKKTLYDTHTVDYIWVTKEMKEGLVWSKKNEGLLLLLKNNETFKNVYKSDEIEIWKIIKRNE